mmetsp:Transcript_30246/g.46258  ORF Transcript_30246/g.46258 Transcript_30246/m.46258 type:complete len:132 (-) Transcript_30246:2015-2410(-)|eukprot:CAMPEP_0170510222 /NCGR_PEP_ID=MMETSP0208-20121228/65648_1 /TAXON_ID=197538 /ORGANISM="Strombidium inclinatum, Strain S3" /LENGTH=131 /DNA_ID=CAMNT_0010793671 /DNA_START=5333 /DNA_END=5728 /DNA_ORIENTATION=+
MFPSKDSVNHLLPFQHKFQDRKVNWRKNEQRNRDLDPLPSNSQDKTKRTSGLPPRPGAGTGDSDRPKDSRDEHRDKSAPRVLREVKKSDDHIELTEPSETKGDRKSFKIQIPVNSTIHGPLTREHPSTKSP